MVGRQADWRAARWSGDDKGHGRIETRRCAVLDLTTPKFAAADAIRVSLHGSDGNVPSGRLYVLTDPASIGGDAFYVFTAPANAAQPSGGNDRIGTPPQRSPDIIGPSAGERRGSMQVN